MHSSKFQSLHFFSRFQWHSITALLIPPSFCFQHASISASEWQRVTWETLNADLMFLSPVNAQGKAIWLNVLGQDEGQCSTGLGSLPFTEQMTINYNTTHVKVPWATDELNIKHFISALIFYSRFYLAATYWTCFVELSIKPIKTTI